MHRIFHDLGWVDAASFKQGPDKTRVIIESWLPKELWSDINLIVVGFGQQAQQHRSLMLKRCGNFDVVVFPTNFSASCPHPSQISRGVMRST